MRVLHLIPSMGGGGAERELSLLAKPLASACELHVALIAEGPNFARLSESGATVHRIGVASNYDPRLVTNLRSIVRRVRPSLVSTWLTQMDIAGGSVARWAGVPWVLAERASAPFYRPSIKNRLRIAAAGGARIVQANSQQGVDYWKSVRPSLPGVVIPNAVAVEEIDAIAPANLAAITGGRRLVLAAGRFDPQKNFHVLVDALARVLATHDDTVAAICGRGPLEDEIRAVIAERGLADRILMPGYVLDIWSWMKAAAAFVSISHFEGQPNTVVEAAACGAPLVVSDIPEHREFLSADSAQFADRHDPASVAAAIDATITDCAAAKTRAAAARRIVSAWTLDAIAARHVQLYESIL